MLLKFEILSSEVLSLVALILLPAVSASALKTNQSGESLMLAHGDQSCSESLHANSCRQCVHVLHLHAAMECATA